MTTVQRQPTVGDLRDREDSYLAPYCEATGGARSARFMPESSSLWMVVADLDRGAEVQWGSDHGDEALFVLSGSLATETKESGSHGAIVVEAGVATSVRAVADTRVAHFGPVDRHPPIRGPLGPPRELGRGVHSFTADEGEALRTGYVTFFTDGTCPTCRAALFLVDRRHLGEPNGVASHIHSEDEILYVIDGSMRVGREVVRAGACVAVPSDLRYSFRTDGPLRFLNYRRDASTVLKAPGSAPYLESRAGMAARVERGDVVVPVDRVSRE